ncbi:hypothetical protein FACS189418_8290 [Clostridia bacterium]|nr:hypothetical protein FACS189418_8290 [Clostridia bacterium]
MKNKTIALYGQNRYYLEHFTEYLNHQVNSVFRGIYFPSWENLYAYQQEHILDMVLLEGEINFLFELESMKEILHRYLVFYLSEKSRESAKKEMISLYKYQSMENILHFLFDLEDKEKGEQTLSTMKEAETLAVFSPLSGCGKTSLALALGQICSRESSTLYLNFEEYSACSWIGEQKNEEYSAGTLSELFYYFHQKKEFYWEKIHSFVYGINGLECIRPVQYAEDLFLLSAKEYAEFIQELKKGSGYSRLILDINLPGERATEILKVCSVVYMPVRYTGVASKKIEQFEINLNKREEKNLWDKIHKIEIPDIQADYVLHGAESLMWNEYGDLARTLLRGEK